MKHRTFIRLAAVFGVMALVTAACGRNNNKSSTSNTTATSEAKKTLTPVPGFDGTTIKLGVLSPLSGPVAVIGKPLTDGNDVYFKSLNAKGGIAGKYKVELVEEDSLYDAPTAVQKYQKIKDQVVMFAQILGTPITNALLPQLKADNATGSPASLDAAWLKEPNLLPFGAPYQIQFINGADWYINQAGGKGKNICMMATDTPYGDAGVEGLNAAAKAENFTVKSTARFKDSDQDFTAQISQLKNAACDAVFLTALPSGTGPILGAAAKLGFTGQFIGQSPTWVTALSKSPQLLPVLKQSFTLVGEGPQWGDDTVPGMKQMLADIQAFKPDQQPDGYFQFGYSQAAVVTKLLEKAVALGDLSKAGIVDANKKLGKVDVGGLFGSFDYSGSRNPSRENTIFKVDETVPGALKKVAVVSSTAAKNFTFS